MYKQYLSPTFVKRFRKLPVEIQERIRFVLTELRKDPFTRRTGIHIRHLAGFDKKKWRVRVGPYRIIYMVEDNTIRVIEVFPRGRGYRFEIF